ncbi:hypothetical protein JXC34_04940, partial [Candidatus Woesearchaeota archaeon]|nr:hypothetical protein [Candidatus Woesearchaeota archaeon]
VVRHPIYLSFILFFFSLFLILPNLLTLFLFQGNLRALVWTAKKEEELLESRFKGKYRKYRKNTGFLIPFLK